MLSILPVKRSCDYSLMSFKHILLKVKKSTKTFSKGRYLMFMNIPAVKHNLKKVTIHKVIIHHSCIVIKYQSSSINLILRLLSACKICFLQEEQWICGGAAGGHSSPWLGVASLAGSPRLNGIMNWESGPHVLTRNLYSWLRGCGVEQHGGRDESAPVTTTRLIGCIIVTGSPTDIKNRYVAFPQIIFFWYFRDNLIQFLRQKRNKIITHRSLKPFTSYYFLQASVTYLGTPVFIKVIYARDASSIAIRVIHVPHVSCPISRITRHHCLKTEDEKAWLVKTDMWWRIDASYAKISYVSVNNRGAVWTNNAMRTELTWHSPVVLSLLHLQPDTSPGCSQLSCVIIIFKPARK